MAAMLETPSRIWRRIEAVQDREMPSLPSLPSFDDSDDEGNTPSRIIEVSEDDSLGDISLPVHSTPATSNHTAATTILPPLSAASTARFAHSIALRSSKSSIGPTTFRKSQKDSFDITEIPSLSVIPKERSSYGRDYQDEHDQPEEPDIFIHSRDGEPAGDQEYSISDALQSVSRSSTPTIPKNDTPKKPYDYSISLKSEPKASWPGFIRLQISHILYAGFALRQVSQCGFTEDSCSNSHAISYSHQQRFLPINIAFSFNSQQSSVPQLCARFTCSYCSSTFSRTLARSGARW